MEEEDKKKYDILCKYVHELRYHYHCLDESLLPDSVMDCLKKEVEDYEKKYPHFITPSSPSQMVPNCDLKESFGVEI